VLDGSLSIGQDNFDTKMTEYVINTFCGFRDTRNNATYQAGAIIFNQKITTAIPFQEFTPDQFEAQVNSKIKGQPLKCCTTHAEAAIVAKEMFDAVASDDGYENIAFFVTDGQPYINYLGGKYGIGTQDGGSGWYTSRGFKLADWSQGSVLAKRGEERAIYAAQVVPKYLKELRDANVRVFFVGVPHKNPAKNVRIEYFKGEDNEICFVNTDVPGKEIENCEDINPLLARLVSSPADDHAFAVQDWTMKPLVDTSLEKICKEWTPPDVNCGGKVRDLLILVDTSESMDPVRYKQEMMDVVKGAGSQLDFQAGSRVAVGTFGSRGNTRMRIPLQTYTNAEAFSRAVDSRVKNVRLECCTNHAEALVMAQEHFRARYKEGHDKILLVITDGTPFQNFGKDTWEWNKAGALAGTVLDRCDYTTRIVPAQAESLQNDGVRVVLAGVLNRNGRAPMAEFFNGGLAGSDCCVNQETNKACLVDNQNEWCSSKYNSEDPKTCHKYTSASVVSSGENNIYTATTWDLDEMTEGIKTLVCNSDPIPTPPPTTRAPTTQNPQPTKKPTPPPTPDPDSLDPVDFIVMLDSSHADEAQQDACGGNCRQKLYGFANNVTKVLQNRVKGGLYITAHYASCSQIGALYPRFDWANKKRWQNIMLSKVRTKSWVGAKCVAGMLNKLSNIIEGRKHLNRKYAVLVLTHGGQALDNCAAAGLTSAITGSGGGKIYVATVSDDGDHRTMCATMGATGSVSDALIADSYEAVANDILADLSPDT